MKNYEIATPESVGVKQTSLVLANIRVVVFKDKLTSLGYVDVTDDIVENALVNLKF